MSIDLNDKNLIWALRTNDLWPTAEIDGKEVDAQRYAADRLEALLTEVKRQATELDAMQSVARHAEELETELSSVTAERDAAIEIICSHCVGYVNPHLCTKTCEWNKGRSGENG